MTSSDSFDVTGRCLCGAVRFSARLAAATLNACHCSQCRRWSGHVWADADATDLHIDGQDSLRWYRSSDRAERGFCATCGSSLFWRRVGADTASVAAGALDAPTGLRLAGHIWTDFKGDYYDIADGLPQSGHP